MRTKRASTWERVRGCYRKQWFKHKEAALGFAAKRGYHDQRAYQCPYGCSGWHLTTKPKSGW